MAGDTNDNGYITWLPSGEGDSDEEFGYLTRLLDVVGHLLCGDRFRENCYQYSDS